MNEVYWITRLDSLEAFFNVSIVFITFAAIGAIVGYFTFSDDDEYDIKIHKLCSRHIMWTIPTLLFIILCNIFVPNTKEALMIYGIGGTIEYIKSNDKAKKLPDKCINALDKFISDYTEESSNKN